MPTFSLEEFSELVSSSFGASNVSSLDLGVASSGSRSAARAQHASRSPSRPHPSAQNAFRHASADHADTAGSRRHQHATRNTLELHTAPTLDAQPFLTIAPEKSRKPRSMPPSPTSGPVNSSTPILSSLFQARKPTVVHSPTPSPPRKIAAPSTVTDLASNPLPFLTERVAPPTCSDFYTRPSICSLTSVDMMSPPPLLFERRDSSTSASSSQPRSSLSDRLRAMPFSRSMGKISLATSQRSPTCGTGLTLAALGPLDGGMPRSSANVRESPDASIGPWPFRLPLLPKKSEPMSRSISNDHRRKVTVPERPPAPRRTTSTPMLRTLPRETGRAPARPEHADEHPADITRVLTPDEDPFAKADVVAVDFVSPFAMPAATITFDHSASSPPRRSRETTARPIGHRTALRIDTNVHPLDTLSPLSPALSIASFTSVDGEKHPASVMSHNTFGVPRTRSPGPPLSPLAGFASPRPSSSSRPSCPSPSPRKPAPIRRDKSLPRPPPKEQPLSPHSIVAPSVQMSTESYEFVQAPHDMEPVSSQDKKAMRKSVKAPLFAPASPPRRGSAPMLAVGDFPVAKSRLPPPAAGKERARGAAHIWDRTPAERSLKPSLAIQPASPEMARRPGLRERLGSAFKLGLDNMRQKSPIKPHGARRSADRERDVAGARQPDSLSPLFPLVGCATTDAAGFVTPLTRSPHLSPAASPPASAPHSRQASAGEPVEPRCRVPSSDRTPTPGGRAGGGGCSAMPQVKAPSIGRRKGRRLKAAVPKAKPAPATELPLAPPELATLAAASSGNAQRASSDHVTRKERLQPAPDGIVGRPRKGSFPWEVASQRSLGDLDLMFTSARAARESFIALDDESDHWAAGEREAWECGSVRYSVHSSRSPSPKGGDNDAPLFSNPWTSGGEAASLADANSTTLSSSASGLGLLFADRWLKPRSGDAHADGETGTIASSEGTEASMEEWPLPPKRAIVLGEDGAAWTHVEGDNQSFFNPDVFGAGQTRHQFVVAQKKHSLTSEADTCASEDTFPSIATPALSSSSLSPTLPAGDLDGPITPATGFGFTPGPSVQHSPTSRSYLPASQAKEIVRRLQETGRSGPEDFLSTIKVDAEVVLAAEEEEEDIVLPFVRPLRLGSRRMSVASAYYSARSRPSTAGSRFDPFSNDADVALDNAARLSAVVEAPEKPFLVAPTATSHDDSGIFVTSVSH